jgi:hypothetical protein
MRRDMQQQQQRAATTTSDSEIDPLYDSDETVINAVIRAHIQTNVAVDGHLSPVAACADGNAPSSRVACPLHHATMACADGVASIAAQYSPGIQGVVDFARALPGFELFSHEDRITLLKVSVQYQQ